MSKHDQDDLLDSATTNRFFSLNKTRSGTRLVVIAALTCTLYACGKNSDDSVDNEASETETETETAAEETETETKDKAPAVTSAPITNIEPIKETFQQPREVCENVVVTEQADVKDTHQVGGSVAGAAVGGIIGNQVGSGRGKTAATAAGAALGGYAGNKAQERYQEGKTTERTEQQCHTVNDTQERVIGYLVTYTLNGSSGTIKMDQAPSGSTLPVVNGKIAL